MKEFEVNFRLSAITDMQRPYDYIEEQSGAQVATAYIDRIEEACLSLGRFPNRGRSRDDLFRGLRVVGFERRVTIAFIVGEADVTISRIMYGGRDYEALLTVPEE